MFSVFRFFFFKEFDSQQFITTAITRWNTSLCVPSCYPHKISLCPEVQGEKRHFCWTAFFSCLPVYNVSCEVAGESAWEEKEGLLFGKKNEEANKLQELTLLLCLFHSSSFSRVNPLALSQFPLRAGLSDSISICLNYKIPTPYSLTLAITYTLGTHCPLV